MEHIVRSIGSASELADYIHEGYEEGDEEDEEQHDENAEDSERLNNVTSRSSKRASRFGLMDGQDVSPDMERQLLANSKRASKRYSALSMSDVADRHLRDKTDAIADIIRNISEQCAAAVEGLQLANEAAEIDDDQVELEDQSTSHSRQNSESLSPMDQGSSDARSSGTGHLTPQSERSSIPPTPDLVHQRSSTALSMASTAPTNYTARESLNHNTRGPDRTKIVEDEDAERSHAAVTTNGSGSVKGEPSTEETAKQPPVRPSILSRVLGS